MIEIRQELSRKILAGLLLSLISGCATPPPEQREPVSEKVAAYDPDQLQSIFAIKRSATDLGLVEKPFNSCEHLVKGDSKRCGTRVLSVVNFQLLCRDSEETVSTTATNFTPVAMAQVKWKFAGQGGTTKTNSEGYGSVQFVGETAASGQRLVLIVGQQFLGLEISEVNRIVVPIYWCK